MSTQPGGSFDVDLSMTGQLGNRLLGELNKLRELDGIHWSEATGGWLITRHADVEDALQGKFPLSLRRVETDHLRSPSGRGARAAAAAAALHSTLADRDGPARAHAAAQAPGQGVQQEGGRCAAALRAGARRNADAQARAAAATRVQRADRAAAARQRHPEAVRSAAGAPRAPQGMGQCLPGGHWRAVCRAWQQSAARKPPWRR